MYTHEHEHSLADAPYLLKGHIKPVVVLAVGWGTGASDEGSSSLKAALTDVKWTVKCPLKRSCLPIKHLSIRNATQG